MTSVKSVEEAASNRHKTVIRPKSEGIANHRSDDYNDYYQPLNDYYYAPNMYDDDAKGNTKGNTRSNTRSNIKGSSIKGLKADYNDFPYPLLSSKPTSSSIATTTTPSLSEEELDLRRLRRLERLRRRLRAKLARQKALREQLSTLKDNNEGQYYYYDQLDYSDDAYKSENEEKSLKDDEERNNKNDNKRNNYGEDNNYSRKSYKDNNYKGREAEDKKEIDDDEYYYYYEDDEIKDEKSYYTTGTTTAALRRSKPTSTLRPIGKIESDDEDEMDDLEWLLKNEPEINMRRLRKMRQQRLKKLRRQQILRELRQQQILLRQAMLYGPSAAVNRNVVVNRRMQGNSDNGIFELLFGGGTSTATESFVLTLLALLVVGFTTFYTMFASNEEEAANTERNFDKENRHGLRGFIDDLEHIVHSAVSDFEEHVDVLASGDKRGEAWLSEMFHEFKESRSKSNHDNNSKVKSDKDEGNNSSQAIVY